MSPELKEQLQYLAANNKQSKHPNFICIGYGDKQNPLGKKFGIPRERLYSDSFDEKQMEKGFSGDGIYSLYYVTKDYYNALLSDTQEDVEEDKTTPDIFEQLKQALMIKMGNPWEIGSFSAPKNEEMSKNTPKNSENSQKSSDMQELAALQEDYILRNNLTIGSKVKVLKKYKDYGKMPTVNWASEMDNTIGKVGIIEKIDASKPSIWVRFKGEGDSGNPFNPSGDRVWVYAYHSLQPYYDEEEALQLENSYVALVKPDGSTLVNGLSVTFDELEELYFKAGKIKQSKKSSGEIDDGSTETWQESSGDW